MGLSCVTAAQLWPDFTAFPVSSEFGYKERQTAVHIPLHLGLCKLKSSTTLRQKLTGYLFSRTPRLLFHIIGFRYKDT
jgi:hypothetical protein